MGKKRRTDKNLSEKDASYVNFSNPEQLSQSPESNTSPEPPGDSNIPNPNPEAQDAQVSNSSRTIDPAVVTDALVAIIEKLIDTAAENLNSARSNDNSADESKTCANATVTASHSLPATSAHAASASSSVCAHASACQLNSPDQVDTFSTYADLFIFKLDDAVVENIFLGAILSMEPEDFLSYFKQTYLRAHCKSDIAEIEELFLVAYNRFLFHLMTNIKKANDKKDFLLRLIQSYRISEEESCTPCALRELVRINNKTCLPELHPRLKACFETALLTYVYRTFAVKLTEFQLTVGEKLNYLEKDLVFLSTEITRLSRADAGITQIASALSLSTAARFAEDNNYDKIFRAVEEVAETIKDLAKIYQERLKLLNSLLPLSLTPRPTTEENK